MRVVVVGAGVVGITTACYLAKRGMQVTVVDRAPAIASGASFANGAQLSYSFTDALARPGMLRRIPGLLLGKDPGIRLRLLPDMNFLRWGVHFLAQCTQRNYERNTAAVLELAMHSALLLEELQQEFALDFAFRKAGKLVLLRTAAEFAAAEKSAALKRRLGCELAVLSFREACEIEPSLTSWRDDYAGAVYSAGDHVGDAQAFSAGLASCLRSRFGVDFRLGCEAQSLRLVKGRARGVMLQNDALEADAVVICLGAWAPRFFSPRQLRRPIVPLRGYSVTLPLGGCPPQASISDVEHRIVFSTLRDSVRIAGYADFFGFDERADSSRVEMLLQTARRIAPDAANYTVTSRHDWGGFRPMTPDSQPLVGRASIPGLYLNCGHGMLGWTLACATGYKLAQEITA